MKLYYLLRNCLLFARLIYAIARFNLSKYFYNAFYENIKRYHFEVPQRYIPTYWAHLVVLYYALGIKPNFKLKFT